MSTDDHLSSTAISPISCIRAEEGSSEPCNHSSDGESYLKDSVLEEEEAAAGEDDAPLDRESTKQLLTTSTPFPQTNLQPNDVSIVTIDSSGFFTGADSTTRTDYADSGNEKEQDLNEEDPTPPQLRPNYAKPCPAKPLQAPGAGEGEDPLVGVDSDLPTPTKPQERDGAEDGEEEIVGVPEREMPPISKLMQRTGYSIVQQNGQRRYGPPPDWAGQSPPRGSEVFVGKIPRDCFEDELVPVLEQAGKIYELRLMVDFSGFNRGYAFVVYSNPAEAKKCVKLFNNYEIRKGRLLGVCMSIDNCRLFIGGIPKRVVRDDILEEIEKVTEGVKNVIVYPSASDKTKNRGFAFIEYESHRMAAMARKKLISGRIQLWGHNVAVDWAEPEIEVDEDVMAGVKVIYVRNLMLSTTEAQLEETFSAIAPVERVKKIRDYAFVHFQHRDGALMAITQINGVEIDGTTVEVTLAKPVDKDTLALHRQARRNRSFMQGGMSPIAYLPVADSCGGSYFAPLYGPPSPCGPNEGHSFLPSRGRSKSYTRSRPPRSPSCTSGQGYYMSPPHTPYRSSGPYMPTCYESPRGGGGGGRFDCTMYDMMDYHGHHQEGGHTHLAVPRTPPQAGHKMHRGSPIQVLEELCHKNHWGTPIYSLHTAAGPGETPLYYYKVTVSALNLQFQPNKLARSVEEAKLTAAQYTLTQIGYPMDGPPEVPHSPHIPHSAHGPTIPSSCYFPYVSTPTLGGKVGPKLWESPQGGYYHAPMETYQPGGPPGPYQHHLGAGIWAPKGPGPAAGL